MNALLASLKFFLYLALEAGEFLVYLWPVSVLVAALGILSITARSPLRDPDFRRHSRILLLPYAIPIAILVVGTVLRYELYGPPHPNWLEPPAWYFGVVYTFVGIHCLALTALPFSVRIGRLRAVGCLLPGVWLSICAAIPTGFSIAGVGP